MSDELIRIQSRAEVVAEGGLRLVLLERMEELTGTKTPVPYDDCCMPLLREAMESAESSLTDEQREHLQQKAEAMTSDDWDAFAEVVIRPGPSVAEMELNAIGTNDD